MAALSGCGMALGATFYVDVNWTGSGTGTASDPYRTIGSAVTAANAGAGNQIWIADGSYTSTVIGGLESFGASGLTLTQGTAIYGGYAGWQSGSTFDWSTRAPRSTVIDLTGANSRALYRGGSGELNWGPTVDGLTIRNGNVTGDGGAIGGTLTDHSGWTINNCLFDSNRASGKAGAVYLRAQWNVSGYVTNCDFVNNTAGSSAGALYLDTGALIGGNKMSVQNSTFRGNAATTNGGAVYATVGGTTAEIRGCLLANNTAGTANKGGAIGLEAGNVGNFGVYQTRLIGNSAQNGSALADIGNNRRATIYMENCLVAGNTNVNGGVGALYTSGNGTSTEYAFDLAYCTVAGNSAGGIYNQESFDPPAYPADGNLRVRDSIVANNGTFGINYLWGNASNHHNPVLDFNDVFGQTNNYLNNAVGQATNSLSADPLFLSAGAGDYRLTFGSPAIDAATNLGIALDLYGVVRPYPTGAGGYDMGAFEFPEPGSLLLATLAGVIGLRIRRRTE